MLRWGILGTGTIARVFANGLAHATRGKLLAVASRSLQSGSMFASEFPGIRTYSGYDELLADPEIDVVYISTPHAMHAEWCVKAARAGKHILCEKPLTLNHAEAVSVVETARERGVFLMEAFMYRCHPQTAQLVELVRNGAIGDVRGIQASFGFESAFDPQNRLFNPSLGGGAILDVGCYTMAIARLIAGAASDRPFSDPEAITGLAEMHPQTSVDIAALASVSFPGGILAQLATAISVQLENAVSVFGSSGSLHLPCPPYIGARFPGERVMHLRRDGHDVETLRTKTDVSLFTLEADAAADAIIEGKMESHFMPLADTLGNMAALDAWRSSLR